MEDSAIIEMFFDRDERAIIETDKKYGKRLMRFSENITGNFSDAEECVNDTYLAVWNKIPPTRPEHFWAFICKIARFLCYDLCDKKKAAKRNAVVVELTREMQEMLPDGGFDEYGYDGAESVGAKIDLFLRTEDELCRRIFVSRYFYSESVNDIASAIGLTSSRVSGILFRMRKRLKKYLEETGDKGI